MSLTSNIKGKTPIGEFLLNSVKLPELHPNALRNPKITHDGKRWWLIGTAFDYLVRMSLSSSSRGDFVPRIAQKALSNYLSERRTAVENDGFFGPRKLSQEEIDDRTREDEQHQDKFSKCCAEVDRALKENDFSTMAMNSLSFARLDPYFRIGSWTSWDDEWASKETDKIDAEELVKLHEMRSESFIIPDGELLHNPGFYSGYLVGGADADIIVDGAIIDWKVVNNPRRELRKYLAQMVGYALLSNLDGVPVETCTLYFARHGEHLSLPFTDIMNHTMEEAKSLFMEIADPNNRFKGEGYSPFEF